MANEKERAEGAVTEAKGHVKQAAGAVTGDDKTKAEGKLDEMKGKLEQGLADVKDKASDLIDRVTGDDKKK